MGLGPTDDPEPDDRGNWTIKNVSAEARKRALSCATKRGESMAVWMERAIQNQASLEADDRVLPPGQRDGQRGQPTELPAVVTAAMGTSELAVLVQALQTTATATGRPAPRDVAGHVYGLMRARMREARGLLPPPPREAPRMLKILRQMPDQDQDHEAGE
jgi:hypothetical protein